jgi:hypothetical protein
MNHYCPGLVVLNRANLNSRSASQRRGYLVSAKKKFDYTISAMKKECPIRGEVVTMDRLVNGLLGAAK